MRRRARSPDGPAPSLKLPLALGLAALGALAAARWWLGRAPPAPLALDAGSYVAVVSPLLHRAGCAAPSCHAGGAPMRLAPALADAAAALAELDAVRPFVGVDPARSPLLARATSPAHAGAGALSPGGCEARALARWVGGSVVRRCPPPLPAPPR
jgi:hypothetical protein